MTEDRIKIILQIATETGAEYMQSMWTNINSQIIAQLPNPTVSEGCTLQFNACVKQAAALIAFLQEYANAHEVDLGTPEQMVTNFMQALAESVALAISARKEEMN